MTPRMSEETVLTLALEGRIHAASGQTAELVALAGNLALLPDPEIDATWANALEARLIGAEVVQPTLHLVEPAPAPEPLPTNVVQLPARRFVVRRALAGAVAAAMLSAFPVVAVAGSLPGTPGYGVKRSIERLHIAMFGDEVADGFAYMALAQRRVGEAGEMIALKMRPELISLILRDAMLDLNRSSRLVLDNTDDEATLQRFSDQAAETQRRIAALASDAPQASQRALQGALDASIALQADVARLLAVETTPGAPVASIRPTAPDAASGQTQTQSSGTTVRPQRPSRGIGDAVDHTTPGGTPKEVDEAARTCPVIGQEQGAGDVLAPVSRQACPLRDATY